MPWMLPAAIAGGGLLAGGGSAIGAAISSATSLKSAREQMKFQAGMAQQQMAFQRDMSSTAFTRATADLRNAGLNPLLAYTKGAGGASAPQGASGQGASYQAGDYGQAGALAGQSAIAVARSLQEIKTSAASARLANAKAGLDEKRLPKEALQAKMWSSALRLMQSLEKKYGGKPNTVRTPTRIFNDYRKNRAIDTRNRYNRTMRGAMRRK